MTAYTANQPYVQTEVAASADVVDQSTEDDPYGKLYEDAYSSAQLSPKEESDTMDPISGALVFDPILDEPVFHAAPGAAGEAGTSSDPASEAAAEPASESASASELATKSDSEKTEAASEENEGGYGHVFSEVGAGMVEELVEHPGRVVASAVIGVVSAAMIALTLPEIAFVAAVGAGLYGAWSMLKAAPEWVKQADIAANPDKHTDEQVKEAEAELRSIGGGAVNVAAAIVATPVGGIAGKMLERPVNAYLTRTLMKATTGSAEAPANTSVGSALNKQALKEEFEYGAISYAGDPIVQIEAQTFALGHSVLNEKFKAIEE